MNTKPDEAFVSSLEWQLRTELRRPAAASVFVRRGKFALAAVSAVVGAACMAAVSHVRETRSNTDVVARLEVREIAAKRAAALAETVRDKQAVRYDAGLASASELRQVEDRVARIVFDARIAVLDLEEARSSRRAPRTDLAAPVVAGRDFVAERLAAESELLAAAAARRRADASDVKARVEAGAAPAGDQLEADARTWAAQSAADSIRERLAIRKQFSSGAETAASVEAQDLILRVNARLAAAQSSHDAAKARCEHLRALHGTGQVSLAELTHAEMELASEHAELELVHAELAAATGG